MEHTLVITFIVSYVFSNFHSQSFDILQYITRELIQRVSGIFHNTPKYKVNSADIANKFVVITDGDSQYGRYIAKLLVENGAKVIVGFTQTDTLNWSRELKKKLRYDAYLKTIGLNMDYKLSIMLFAHSVLAKTDRIDILICNACVMSNTTTRTLATASNYELHFSANHLGHFYLTNRLFDGLKASANARIVIESSASHIYGTINENDINMENNYTTPKAYFQSKLANILFARHLAQISSIRAYSVHPGSSRLRNELGWSYKNNKLSFIGRSLYRMYALFGESTEQATQTTLYCALDASVANQSGFYYSNCGCVETNDLIVNNDMARSLWNLSCDMLRIDRYSFKSLKSLEQLSEESLDESS